MTVETVMVPVVVEETVKEVKENGRRCLKRNLESDVMVTELGRVTEEVWQQVVLQAMRCAQTVRFAASQETGGV